MAKTEIHGDTMGHSQEDTKETLDDTMGDTQEHRPETLGDTICNIQEIQQKHSLTQ